ncbi:MAG: hypothetical protein ABI602_03655 [Candidatus Saccharibacteria bacterium]
MPPERVTPIDEFSGIPLPLAPQYMAERPSRYKPNDHHSWHSRLDPLLHDSVGGLALRGSRVQMANFDTHNLDYHRDNFDGPPLPQNDAERLRPIVLAAAGYVPDRAISFTPQHHAVLVPLSKQVRAALWNKGKIRVERFSSVQAYLQEITFSQDFSYFENATIDEFLTTADESRRQQIGRTFLTYAVRSAIEPISPTYSQAYRAELLPRYFAQTADRFVLGRLAKRNSMRLLCKRLEERLAA